MLYNFYFIICRCYKFKIYKIDTNHTFCIQFSKIAPKIAPRKMKFKKKIAPKIAQGLFQKSRQKSRHGLLKNRARNRAEAKWMNSKLLPNEINFKLGTDLCHFYRNILVVLTFNLQLSWEYNDVQIFEPVKKVFCFKI